MIVVVGSYASSLMPRQATTRTEIPALPATIAALWGECALSQLRTRRAYEEATALCTRLAVRRLNPAQREYFHELTALVEAYENSHGEHTKAAASLVALAKRE